LVKYKAGICRLDQNFPLTLFVTQAEAGKRLDAFLAAQTEGWSRARLQRLIEDAEVLVNGHVVKPSYRLHSKDEIDVDLTQLPSTAFLPENIPINVIHEDEDLIVVNKPAGMVVHPAAGVPQARWQMRSLFIFKDSQAPVAKLGQASSIVWTKARPVCWSSRRRRARMKTSRINFAREKFSSLMSRWSTDKSRETPAGSINQLPAILGIARGWRSFVVADLRFRFTTFASVSIGLRCSMSN